MSIQKNAANTLPPLCFTGGNANVIYKSKIAEIIRKFFA